MKIKGLETGKIQQRTIEAQIRAVEKSSKTYELSFSSESPYERWFGLEILSHDKDAIDLKRLEEIGVVLFTHGRDPKYGRMPIAKIDKIWVDETEGKGKAQITFDDDEDSERISQKVSKGLLKGVSVGYIVSNWEEVAAGKKSINGKFSGPAAIAVRWTPFEISIEPTPADPEVGIGRDIDSGEYRAGSTPEPVTDKDEQQKEFHRLKAKIYKAYEEEK